MSSVTKICTVGTQRGGSIWVNPSNITAVDYNYASCTLDTELSNQLIGNSFGFSFGGNTTIVGVQVILRRAYASGAGGRSFVVRLDDGSSGIGTSKSQSLSSTLTDYTLGSTTDLWGLSSSTLLSLLNTSNFGINIVASTANVANFHLDAVEVTIYYTNPSFPASSNILGSGDLSCAIHSIYTAKAKLSGGNSLLLKLSRLLGLKPVSIIGACLLSDIISFGILRELLYRRKILSPSMRGVEILQSSILPKDSYITKACYIGGSKGSYYAFSLNGGRKYRLVGDTCFVRDRLGNWVLLKANVGSLSRIMETSTIIEMEQADFTIPILEDFGLTSLVFEEVAKDLYGDANLGVLLRQLFVEELTNKEKGELFPDKEALSRVPIEPESHIWERVPESKHYDTIDEVQDED